VDYALVGALGTVQLVFRVAGGIGAGLLMILCVWLGLETRSRDISASGQPSQ